jgi:hypothetical protein
MDEAPACCLGWHFHPRQQSPWHGPSRVTIKEGSELFTGPPWKTLKLAKKYILNFDSKFGFKSIILVQMALNF